MYRSLPLPVALVGCPSTESGRYPACTNGCPRHRSQRGHDSGGHHDSMTGTWRRLAIAQQPLHRNVYQLRLADLHDQRHNMEQDHKHGQS